MTVPPVLRTTHVHRRPEEAFALFTERIGAWWPLPTHGLYGGNSGGVEFRGGRIIERSLTGEETVWGEVVTWEPPQRLVFTWHPGSVEGPASSVEITFTADDDGTRIELIHTGWEAFGDLVAASRRDSYVGPNTWGAVLDHYTDIADRVTDHADPAALSSLRDAYDEFYAEALRGQFDPPPPGEWSAAEVIAHIAVNDDALSSVCRGLIFEKEMRLENTEANNRERLTTASAGRDLAELVEWGRTRSQQLLALAGRLNEAQLATEVHCLLRDGDDVAVDGPMAWSRLLLTVQPGFHLPNHTEQLRSLRSR